MAKCAQLIPSVSQLDFWVKHNLNVLFVGRHGVGKTSIILEAFKRNDLKYKYFSASTMDPWVDFIGVPKEMNDEKGPFLELVRPKEFRDDEIQALFLDEFNRSHKKVRNAVMELIQFKSINGRVFPNLKIIWAAINPEDDETANYDVDPLDCAQKDRFHIQIEIPYKIEKSYFVSKFGKDISNAAISWWDKLDVKVRHSVSPRRVDVALDVWKNGGELDLVLPVEANYKALLHNLEKEIPVQQFKKLLKEGDKAKIKEFMDQQNNYYYIEDDICNSPAECLDLISEEKILKLVVANKKISSYVFDNAGKYMDVIKSLAATTKSSTLKKLADKAITEFTKKPTVKMSKLTGTAANSKEFVKIADCLSKVVEAKFSHKLISQLSALPMQRLVKEETAAVVSSERTYTGSRMEECFNNYTDTRYIHALGNTYRRYEFANKIADCHYPGMDVQSTITFLHVLNYFMSRSNEKILKPYILPVYKVNYSINALINSGYVNLTDLITFFPNLFVKYQNIHPNTLTTRLV